MSLPRPYASWTTTTPGNGPGPVGVATYAGSSPVGDSIVVFGIDQD